MSTAQQGVWVSNPQAYRERLFKLLGDRHPFDVLAQTASTLADIAAKHSAEVLRARPFEGKWTPNEVVGHLADSEWVYGYRLRLILCEDNPPILGTNQDLWVARQRLNERESAELVEMFRTLRQFNLSLWKRTSPADLTRSGQHNERGAESFGRDVENVGRSRPFAPGSDHSLYPSRSAGEIAPRCSPGYTAISLLLLEGTDLAVL